MRYKYMSLERETNENKWKNRDWTINLKGTETREQVLKKSYIYLYFIEV